MKIRYLPGKKMGRWAGMNGFASRSREARFRVNGHEVGKNEILVRESMSRREQRATIVHERAEVRLMKRGVSYPEAHHMANKEEYQYRRNH